MTEAQTALSRRAVACKGWRWMPGMRWWTDDDRGRLDDYQPEYMARSTDALPDLTDAATVGCLLALVREAYRDASKLWDGHVEVRRDHRTIFYVMGFRHDASGALVEDTLATGRTETEALVNALEGAP